MDPDLLARQRKLGDFNGWMIQLPGVHDAGFVLAANYPETMKVVQLWAGSAPLQEFVRQEALKRGIELIVRPVKYSRKQLNAGKADLFRSSGDPAWGGFVITSVSGTDLEHDGLVVGGHFDPPNLDTPERRAQTLATAKTISSLVVDIEVSDPPVLLVNRGYDYDPFYSGGQMRAVGSIVHCTNGFGVLVPWASNGTAHATTARHCNASQYVSWDNPSESYGVNVTTTPSGGRVLTGHGHWFMFDGAWNDPSGFGKRVVGYYDAGINDYVCSNGAMSGVHCWLKITRTDFTFNDGYGLITTFLASAVSAPYYAGAPGDSGGPVMYPYAQPDWTTVGAVGMIQAGLDKRQEPCGNGTRDPAVACYSTIAFTPMRTIVNGIGGGATLYTNP